MIDFDKIDYCAICGKECNHVYYGCWKCGKQYCEPCLLEAEDLEITCECGQIVEI